MAGEGEVPRKGRVRYAYSPHLDPVLRFDPTGRADKVAAVVEKACRGERLDAGEQEILRAVGKNWEQPWLEWANKQEEHARGHFSVDPVALHIHERISAQAILRAAQREDTERSLFASPEQSYSESLKFYKHDVDWANRLILGDSLQVMSSLAHRENLAGKVQMIYIDPPYGIKFSSNFQSEITRRTVNDTRLEEVPREPEMVRAYRDTWNLGAHSYLGYLAARLEVCRTLLHESGSLFLQISEPNLHRVTTLLDAVFGSDNQICLIPFRKKTMPLGTKFLEQMDDFIVWYAKDAAKAEYHSLRKPLTGEGDWHYQWDLRPSGETLRLKEAEIANHALLQRDSNLFMLKSLEPSGPMASGMFTTSAFGRTYSPPKNGFATTQDGLRRLLAAERLGIDGARLAYKLFVADTGSSRLTSPWQDTIGPRDKRYVVQTSEEVVKRCMLMTTSPGDLVLDPTCGSGTTAAVAEEWGRRWITVDSSRVAVAVARQRLLTARFEHFKTKAGAKGPLGAEDPTSGFFFAKTRRLTLGAIANNHHLDPIITKHEVALSDALRRVNAELLSVDSATRVELRRKFDAASRDETLTDADRRRWILPPDNRDPKEKWTVDAKFAGWYDWEVPFDTDPAWPKPLQDAVTAYRAAWRAKMDEVNACIAANADQEKLVDQPEVVKGVHRVSGPFTVEGVIPEELTLAEDGSVTDHTPNDFEADTAHDDEAKRDADRTRQQNAIAYIQRMIEKLRADGVTFPNNRRMQFAKVESLVDGGEMSGVHARAVEAGKEDATVGIIFGPEFGPVTAQQIEAAVRRAKYYDDIIIAGFAFAPEATAEVENIGSSKSTKARLHLAHMRPELNSTMDALLKQDTKGSNQQLFTVFGLPAVTVEAVSEDGGDGEFTATLEGVDIFNPVEGTVTSTKGEKVSAWFLDSDYDGRCFCACQAFFPNQDAWEKIAKALGTSADPEAFAAFKGRTSLPFRAGTHGRIAVKAIDARGNEVMTVKALKGKA
jgi:adenine-specific DNA-methyltransferase